MSFLDNNTNTATLTPPTSTVDGLVDALKYVPTVVADFPVQQLPESPAVPEPIRKPRKKRAPKHDFKDGFGRVFAHRHSNGNGWVADTAYVGEDCYVGPKASVGQYARVLSGVRIEAKATVTGHALVADRAELRGFACVQGTAIVRDCQLEGHAQISGSADVCGTNMYDRAAVAGSAMVRNSHFRGRAIAGGNAIVIAVTAQGWVEFGNNCNVLRSTICGLVSVQGHCRVFDSTIHNFHWHTSGLRSDAYETYRFRPDLFVIINESAVLQDNVYIYTPVIIRSGTRLMSCHIRATESALNVTPRDLSRERPEEQQPVFDRPVILNKIWRGANVSTREELDRLLNANTDAEQATAIPQITRQHTQSPYSLERLSQGRRIVPV